MPALRPQSGNSGVQLQARTALMFSELRGIKPLASLRLTHFFLLLIRERCSLFADG
jgi:hypothetical protein